MDVQDGKQERGEIPLIPRKRGWLTDYDKQIKALMEKKLIRKIKDTGGGGGCTSVPERPSSPTSVKMMTMAENIDYGILLEVMAR